MFAERVPWTPIIHKYFNCLENRSVSIINDNYGKT